MLLIFIFVSLQIVVKAVETENNLDVKQVLSTVKRSAGFLNLRQIGEKVFCDLVDSWWIIALSLAGNYDSFQSIKTFSYQPQVLASSPSSGSC